MDHYKWEYLGVATAFNMRVRVDSSTIVQHTTISTMLCCSMATIRHTGSSRILGALVGATMVMPTFWKPTTVVSIYMWHNWELTLVKAQPLPRLLPLRLLQTRLWMEPDLLSTWRTHMAMAGMAISLASSKMEPFLLPLGLASHPGILNLPSCISATQPKFQSS